MALWVTFDISWMQQIQTILMILIILVYVLIELRELADSLSAVYPLEAVGVASIYDVIIVIVAVWHVATLATIKGLITWWICPKIFVVFARYLRAMFNILAGVLSVATMDVAIVWNWMMKTLKYPFISAMNVLT